MTCAECGGPVLAAGRGRPRRFCSDACRQRAYRQRARPTWPSATFEGAGWRLYAGRAHRVLASLPAESVQTVVTSPPYYNLRDYDGAEGQLGREGTVDGYVDELVEILEQSARVLRRDGTLWLNISDTYAGFASGGASVDRHGGRGHRPGVVAARVRSTDVARRKSLLMVPSRVVIALQSRGWIVRSDIIWDKPNAMPESVTDRPARRHEHLFLLTRSPRYKFDLDAIREQRLRERPPQQPSKYAAQGLSRYAGNAASMMTTGQYVSAGKNPGDVWRMSTRPSKTSHFAMFPIDLPRRCIAASTSPGDRVLDPFSGSATTGRAALEMGREYVGIDLVHRYLEESTSRLEGLMGV